MFLFTIRCPALYINNLGRSRILTDAGCPPPGVSAIGTSTSSSGCQTKQRPFTPAPAPVDVGTITTGRPSPTGARGSPLPPSPMMRPLGLLKKCLHPPLHIEKRTGRRSTAGVSVAQYSTPFARKCAGRLVFMYLLQRSLRLRPERCIRAMCACLVIQIPGVDRERATG